MRFLSLFSGIEAASVAWTPLGWRCVGVDGYNAALTGDAAATLRAGNGNALGSVPSLLSGMAVRRLTPRECERLQGFPDEYTLHVGAKRLKDGPRYKALGNSFAVNCVRWIGERIERALAASDRAA